MHSSSSDGGESDAMFPSEMDPPGAEPLDNLTPINQHQSDLSPPQSQDFHEIMDTGTNQDIVPESGSAQSMDNGWEPKSEFAKSAELAHEPGAAWNSRKARDEWQRATNQIEDKSFSLSERRRR